jgi:F-type H+-transporting ATPase subunit b
MYILGQLGIDIRLLVAQIINFGLLLWLLSKFLYRPILDRIEKDEQELVKVQNLRRQLESDREEFEKQKTSDLSAAKLRSLGIIKEAEQIAKKITTRAQQQADQESQAILKQAKSRLAEVNHARQKKS